MRHKSPNQFFNDPSAINPQTGQLLNPPPAPPPDPKLLAAQARAQIYAVTSAHQAQKAEREAIHLQVKTQSEIALAKVKADLDAKLSVLDAHLKAEIAQGKTGRSYPPGARKAIDGHHHVPDAQRPGKCLKVLYHG